MAGVVRECLGGVCPEGWCPGEVPRGVCPGGMLGEVCPGGCTPPDPEADPPRPRGRLPLSFCEQND